MFWTADCCLQLQLAFEFATCWRTGCCTLQATRTSGRQHAFVCGFCFNAGVAVELTIFAFRFACGQQVVTWSCCCCCCCRSGHYKPYNRTQAATKPRSFVWQLLGLTFTHTHTCIHSFICMLQSLADRANAPNLIINAGAVRCALAAVCDFEIMANIRFRLANKIPFYCFAVLHLKRCCMLARNNNCNTGNK